MFPLLRLQIFRCRSFPLPGFSAARVVVTPVFPPPAPRHVPRVSAAPVPAAVVPTARLVPPTLPLPTLVPPMLPLGLRLPDRHPNSGQRGEALCSALCSIALAARLQQTR